MSSKLLAIMECVPDSVGKLEQNLHVEVREEGSDIEIQDYGITLSLDNPNIISSYADGIHFWWYFDFENKRSSDLRNRFFDIVRALELSEMYIMCEEVSDIFDQYESDYETIIRSLRLEVKPGEFFDRELMEFDLEELLQGEPYFRSVYPHRQCYHDTFSDLFAQVDEIEKKENVSVLGLTEFEAGHIRVMLPDGSISCLRII